MGEGVEQETWRALISAAPSLAWVLLAAVSLVLLRGPLTQLLGRVREAELPGGVRLSFAEAQLEQAAERAPVEVSAADQRRALHRAGRQLDVLRLARLLWVDDRPAGNREERRLLRAFGVQVDTALSTDEALDRLRRGDYDVMVTDMERHGDREAGLELLDRAAADGLLPPTIVYLLQLDLSKGVPPGAVAVTNRPDELLDRVVDVLKRAAGL